MRLASCKDRVAALLLVTGLAGCSGPMRAGWTAYDRGDDATALRQWTPVAQDGDADAQYLVGLIYDTGRSAPADHVAAAKWYALAAEQGHAAAQNNLGLLYYSGRGVRRSMEQAAEWYGRAAAQGF